MASGSYPEESGGSGTVTTAAPATGDGSIGDPITVVPATSSVPGSMSAADKTKLDVIYRPIRGTSLTDANITRQPWTDQVGEYVLPAATLTGNHTLTLGTNGSPYTAFKVRVTRFDATNNTYAIINGGGGGGTLFTFDPARSTVPAVAEFFFDSTNWLLVGVFPITVA